jgi:SMC interacting uncharacterized protein involved in chromosome segregation
MRNEYETKIYELNEDINSLNKQLKHREHSDYLSKAKQMNNEQVELIQELNERNQKLTNETKSV